MKIMKTAFLILSIMAGTQFTAWSARAAGIEKNGTGRDVYSVRIVNETGLMQSVQMAVPAVALIIGAYYYIKNLKHQRLIRETDLIMKLYMTFQSREMLESRASISGEDYWDTNKYALEAHQLAGFFDGIGILVKKKLVNVEIIGSMFDVKSGWKKLEPWIMAMRNKTGNREIYDNYEYLYNEIKKI